MNLFWRISYLQFTPIHKFKELLTESVGPVPFSAEYLKNIIQTDSLTDRLTDRLTDKYTRCAWAGWHWIGGKKGVQYCVPKNGAIWHFLVIFDLQEICLYICSRWDSFSPISDEHAQQTNTPLCIQKHKSVFWVHKRRVFPIHKSVFQLHVYVIALKIQNNFYSSST